MAVLFRLCFLLAAVAVLGISNSAASCLEFNLIPESEYDKNPSFADDIDKRPLGFKFGIVHYTPTEGQKDPCAYLTNLTGHAVEVLVQTRIPGKSVCVEDDSDPKTIKCTQEDFSHCWNAKSDKVTFTFKCDPAEGCDTDTQIWYRLTPSVGDTDDWCLDRSGDFPRSLLPRPTGQVGTITGPSTGGTASILPKGTLALPVIYLTFLSFWAQVLF